MGRPRVGSPFGSRRHLTILVAVAELGSMREVADTFGTSQPQISRLIRLFEKALGAELFIRNNKGCTPTAVGSVVVGCACRVLAEIDQAERDIRKFKELRENLDQVEATRKSSGPADGTTA